MCFASRGVEFLDFIGSGVENATDPTYSHPNELIDVNPDDGGRDSLRYASHTADRERKFNYVVFGATSGI
jgi:hypothetical protein